MPLTAIFRVLFTLVSLVILGVAVYLLWSWHEGFVQADAQGVLYHVQEPWRLASGLVVGAWSFLGRWAVLPLLAKSDTDKSLPQRDAGTQLESTTGSSLYVESVGAPGGTTVVFTHGWSLDSTIWYYAKRQLSDLHLIFWDLPGLGKSRAASPGAISLDCFAKDLKAVISQSGGRPVVVVGHSIGGMTIQTLARDEPQLFGREIIGVVLVNTTYTNPLKTMIFSGLAQALRRPLLEPMMHLTIWLQPLMWLSAWQSYLSGSAQMGNRLGFGRFVTRSQLDHTTLLSTRNPPGNIARGNLAMFNWDATDAFAQISVPVLVLGGDIDIVTKPEASVAIAGGALNARIHIIDGVNHMGFLERADVYNREIRSFVRSLEDGATPQEPR